MCECVWGMWCVCVDINQKFLYADAAKFPARVKVVRVVRQQPLLHHSNVIFVGADHPLATQKECFDVTDVPLLPSILPPTFCLASCAIPRSKFHSRIFIHFPHPIPRTRTRRRLYNFPHFCPPLIFLKSAAGGSSMRQLLHYEEHTSQT